MEMSREKVLQACWEPMAGGAVREYVLCHNCTIMPQWYYWRSVIGTVVSSLGEPLAEGVGMEH